MKLFNIFDGGKWLCQISACNSVHALARAEFYFAEAKRLIVQEIEGLKV